jgi:succinate dehydrogenase / fumarate reductase membrane anchor subunit
MEETRRPAPQENYLVWGIKILAGLLIIALLGVHFIVNHLLAPEGLLTYADILVYYQNPVVPIMEIGFLIFVVIHALLGLRSIFLDLHPPSRLSRGMDAAFLAAGALMIGYGTWLVIRVVQLGRGG